MSYRTFEVQDIKLFEDWQICDLSKGLYFFSLCNECGECENE